MIKLESVPFNENVYKNRIEDVNGRARSGREKLHENYNEIMEQLSHYTELEQLTPLSDVISDFTQDDLKTLYKFYDSDGYGFDDLKVRIKRLTKSNPLIKKGYKCPYCGIMRQDLHDLDHFIPRSKFQEFSILSSNLVYVCTVCNQDNKEEKFLDEVDGSRLFLHPYFDEELTDQDILKCKISVSDIYLNIKFVINEELLSENPYIYKIACNHLKELDLKKRYRKLVKIDLLDKFLNFFKDKTHRGRRKIRTISQEECINHINGKIDELADVNQNDFELVFWTSLKQCTNWFTNISDKEL